MRRPDRQPLRRLRAIRDTIAAPARDASAQQDLETLRGVIASATDAVYVSPDGLITGMEPGARLKTKNLELPLGTDRVGAGDSNVKNSNLTL